MYPEESLMCSSVLPVFLERVTFTLVRSPLAFHTYPPVTEVLDLLSQLTWTVKSLLLLSASHWRLSSLLFEVIRLPFLVAIGGRPFSSRRAITRSISTCWRSRPLRIAWGHDTHSQQLKLLRRIEIHLDKSIPPTRTFSSPASWMQSAPAMPVAPGAASPPCLQSQPLQLLLEALRDRLTIRRTAGTAANGRALC